MREVLGWDEPDWMGQSVHVAFTAEDVAAGVPERELVTAIRSGRADDNRWMQRRNGERFFAVGSVTPDPRQQRAARGLPQGAARRHRVQKANTDLERLLAAERSLHDRSARESAVLRATLDAIPDALYIGTAEGITECNPQGLALLGAASLDELRAPIDELGGRCACATSRDGRPVKPEELPFMRALRGEVAMLDTWATKTAAKTC